ncbi:MAG: OmpH family outer membrane protein [Prevotellaceae bacterium]|jgi:outer membrane protein|nr:OmpH family outer membrane protein [Prevotellaceae bacterium]
MKSILKILLPLVIVFIASSSFAQQKIGYINADLVISAMPEREEAMKQLEAYQKEHEETYEAIYKEFESMRATYEEKKDTYTAAIREQKEKDLSTLGQKLQEYPTIVRRGEQELGEKLIGPIREKVMNAIDKVAKANGFAYVVNSAALMYTDDAQMTDLVPLVKKELGL